MEGRVDPVLCSTKLNIPELTMKKIVLTTSLHLALLLCAHLAEHPHFDGWLSTTREVLGQQTQAAWLMDWQADEAEVHRSPENALVIVHRDAGSIAGAGALFHGPIIGTGGTRLDPIAPPDTMDGWLHATHTGRLRGAPVVADHFLVPDGDAPRVLVRVVRAVQGSAPVRPFMDLTFLRSLVPEHRPIPQQMPPVPLRAVAGTDSIQPERL